MEEYLKHTDDMNEFALDINACTDILKQQYNVKSTKINLLDSNPNVIDIYFYVDNSKKIVKPGFKKGKLNTISSSELDGTWQVKGEE